MPCASGDSCPAWDVSDRLGESASALRSRAPEVRRASATCSWVLAKPVGSDRPSRRWHATRWSAG